MMYYKKKSTFLVALSILALSAITSANTCTDFLFKQFNTFLDPQAEVYIDSTSIDYYSEQVVIASKDFYDNGKLVKRIKIYDEDSVVTYFYYNSNESVLKKTGKEYINSVSTIQDTLFIEIQEYNDGVFEEKIIRKQTPNYVVEKGTDYLFEFILKQDTVIETYQMNIKKDSVYKYSTFDIADPSDDFKCYEYENGNEKGIPILYKPNEKGFSIQYTYEDNSYNREYFFIKKDNTTSLRKTLKPIKISPRVRYFDLLGRYKFTK